MTALALQSLNFSTNLLEKFWTGLKRNLTAIMVGWQMARQQSANAQIARLLKHEYPGWTVSQITDHLNRKTLGDFK